MNPFSPTTPLEVQRRGWLAAADAVDRGATLPDQVDRAADVEVGGTESEVVYRENKLELHHYESRTDEQHDVPLLIVYALINRPYVLDLQPSRSVVRTLLDHGFDVYLIDWGEPSRLDAALTLGDYVTRYIHNCVDVVCERSGVEATGLLGYCMGGTMSAMYAALHPERVRYLGLLATGLCFDGTGGVLERWGDEDHYDPGQVAETYGNVPAEFLDVGFALMDPVENFLTKYVRLYENIEDDDFVENFARMETWLADGIDVAGETYRQFLADIYQDNRLARGEMRLDGDPVDLDEIDMPVLQIVGEYDHLVPPESSRPFNDLIASDDTEIIEFPTGHIGLSVGSRSHEELWPRVAEWFAERSGDPDRDLERISGVGPAYAARLREAGIEDLTELAEADPDGIAAETDLAPGRVRDWIEQARALVGEGGAETVGDEDDGRAHEGTGAGARDEDEESG